MNQPIDPRAPHSSVPTCHRHPERETHIRCQRCERPICPDCMRDAAVGFQCPDCVREGTRQTRSGLGAFGGARSTDPRLTSMVLIGINAAVFVLLQVVPALVDQFVQRAVGICSTGDSWFPMVTSPEVCQRAGAGVSWAPGLVTDQALWMPLTSMFSHQAIWHIGGNMLVLWFLGPAVEQVFGRARFLAIYFVSGFAGGMLAFVVTSPHSAVLGASGAIWGLMGALVVVAKKVGSDASGLLQLIGLNVVITVVGFQFISWQAHLGGLLGGAVAAAIVVFAPKGPKRSTWQWAGLTALSVAILLAYGLRALALA